MHASTYKNITCRVKPSTEMVEACQLNDVAPLQATSTTMLGHAAVCTALDAHRWLGSQPLAPMSNPILGSPAT